MINNRKIQYWYFLGNNITIFHLIPRKNLAQVFLGKRIKYFWHCLQEFTPAHIFCNNSKDYHIFWFQTSHQSQNYLIQQEFVELEVGIVLSKSSYISITLKRFYLKIRKCFLYEIDLIKFILHQKHYEIFIYPSGSSSIFFSTEKKMNIQFALTYIYVYYTQKMCEIFYTQVQYMHIGAA